MSAETLNTASPPRMRIVYRIGRVLVRSVFLILFRVRVFHLNRVPRTGGVLLVCNHESFLDPLAAALALPRDVHFMARDTLFRHFIFGVFIRAVNAFPVRRGASDVAAFKEALRRLRAGGALLVFPEGTRSCDGRVGSFHVGPILLARRAGVPIVPVALDGTFKAWPRDARWPRPRAVRVTYGHPIPNSVIQRDDPPVLAERIRTRIVQLRQTGRSGQQTRRKQPGVPSL
ncbi:MAG: lysophospholipid acyltransferase family protein [Phycisphaerae bacterium]